MEPEDELLTPQAEESDANYDQLRGDDESFSFDDAHDEDIPSDEDWQYQPVADPSTLDDQTLIAEFFNKLAWTYFQVAQ